MKNRTAVLAEDTTGPVAARAQAISKRYDTGHVSVTALDSVSVNIQAGQFSGIMGPSGSGKSTLMHCMAGLDTVDSGRVFIGDDDITDMSDKELTRVRRDRIGFIFQSFNLLPTLTALENILLPMRLAGRIPDQGWLDTVIEITGLGERLDHRPNQLSGGQQQRVACARALAAKPQVIFADEPTGNLDSRSGAEVLTFLRDSVRQTGQSIVMVTHDPTAAAYTDHVIFLADGRVVDRMDDPTAGRVLERMAEFEPAAKRSEGRA
ncbi:ABC transporter ATP-binding protein [Herbidospora yilanensis]|uniref:ABC transporter ATP-binding protein n=1 Tax=Herbidospora yilanensis TaxID=354426 RepID=UPI000A01C2EF|nr:ABC transporter ATP-binding protein [Herbidospora yilanensis]